MLLAFIVKFVIVLRIGRTLIKRAGIGPLLRFLKIDVCKFDCFESAYFLFKHAYMLFKWAKSRSLLAYIPYFQSIINVILLQFLQKAKRMRSVRASEATILPTSTTSLALVMFTIRKHLFLQ